MIRHQTQSQGDLHNVGYHVIRGHNNPGGEFTGEEFQTLLQNCRIKDVCISAKNPQANAICERMHQTVGNVLRTLLHGESPPNLATAKEFVDESLSIAMHAMRVGMHTLTKSKIGSTEIYCH